MRSLSEGREGKLVFQLEEAERHFQRAENCGVAGSRIYFMKIKEKILLLLIILAGAFFRFYNLNWDNNAHLHPDERFLTMVGNAMALPQNFPDYMNPMISTFNPSNVGFNFFVYGLFPITLNKIIAIILGTDNYSSFTIQGRFLSALADLLVVFLIFKTAYLLGKKYRLDPSIKFFSSFLYSIFVLPIQLSHFFAVDTFLNLFVFASFFFALKFWLEKKNYYLILSAILFGFAFSSKITAVYILPLILYLLASFEKNQISKSIQRSILNFAIFVIISFLVIRVANPYIFASQNILDISPNPLFIENITALKALSSKTSLFPPNVQWINKLPIVFPLQNLIIFGVGVPAFVIFVFGIFQSFKTRGKFMFGSILLWIFGFFIYQGFQNATTMRYFIPIYPFIAIFSGLGLYALYISLKKWIFYSIMILVTLWTALVFSIYTKPHSRVEASHWINRNIPEGSIILSEYWDDALPVYSQDIGKYRSFQLPVFDPDTDEKWKTINKLLEDGDYLILSSNRGWGSIPTVPERYPRMTKFYQELFDGKLAYRKIKEFTSYPSLSYLGVPIEFLDDWAEESFTVYDHPKVMIFKKMK